MNTQQASDSVGKIVDGLTSDQMSNMVQNANQNNFFMYAFIIFALIMIAGMVAIVLIFMRKDTKKDSRQNEQYKNLLDSQASQYRGLLDGYTKMIDQSAKTNSEFRETIADIGNVLRELTNTISKNEAKNDSEMDKFELLFQRFDALKEEISRSNAALHQAFREHETNCNVSHSNLDKGLQSIQTELKRNTDWCRTLNKK